MHFDFNAIQIDRRSIHYDTLLCCMYFSIVANNNIKNFRKKELDMFVSDIPIMIYILIIALIGLILLSIFYKKLKTKTVTILEYVIGITTIIGIGTMFFYR